MTTSSTGQGMRDPADESTESNATLDVDERFHLLQNERRRLVIEHLRDAEDGRVWMRDVAEQVAAREHDTTVAQLSSAERQRVYIPLYQNHLPKLDDAGVIEYNQSRGTVIPTDRVDRLADYIDDSTTFGTDEASDDRSWNDYYLGASGVSAVMLGGAAMSFLPGFLVSLAILALFSTVSVSQYRTQITGGTAPE